MSYRIDISWSNIDGVQDGSSSMTLGEINGTIPETLNDIDYYDFTVYYGSENFEHFAADLTYVKLWSIKRNAYIWYGRVASVNEILSEEGVISKQIHCESEIAYLCDSVCDIPDVIKQMEDHHSYTPGDPVIADTFITALLDKHSQTVGAARRIYPPNGTWNSGGYFEVSGSTGYPQSTINNSLGIDTGSTFSVLKALRDKQGWDIWCEHTDDKVYLKVGFAGSREAGTSGDIIKLRENMRSLTVERAPVSEGRVTRIIPLGGVGADGKRLNIAAVNNYERYLANQTLVAKYGNIDMVVLYDDLVDDGNMSAAQLTAAKNELKSRGQQKLDLLTGGITGIKCRAVDLYEAGQFPSYTFKVGGLYAFDCSFLGLDEYNTSFRLYQKTTDLAAPYDPELVFVLPNATYLTQVTNERMRIQQKLYAQAKAQADRMDNTSIKKTTSSAYDPTTANPGTVYYVDKGNGTGELMLDGTSYGGGGGASTTVENATVLVPENFHDFVIEEELILDIQPPNMLYYGRDTAIICVQGHYMLQVGYDTYGAASYDSEQGWLIASSKDTYDAVIANLDKFGSQLGTEEQGGFLITRRTASSTAGPAYPEEYAYLNARIVSISGYDATNNRYSVSVDERRASTTAPTGNWWEETMTWGNTTLYTHQQYIKAPDNNNTNAIPNTLRLEAIYLVPVTLPYQTAETYATRIPMQTPYGYADIRYPIIVAAFRNKSTSELEYSLTNVELTGTNNRYKIPLISNAEKCFALGLTKRTEPVPSNGGGT